MRKMRKVKKIKKRRRRKKCKELFSEIINEFIISEKLKFLFLGNHIEGIFSNKPGEGTKIQRK